MLSPTDCPIHWFSPLALILEYCLPQSWMELDWSVWSHCPGWCSESKPELDNTRVSNYPGPILTCKQGVMSMIWLSWVTVVLCGLLNCTMTTVASNYTVTFLTVWTLLVEAIAASMSCQYTSNWIMEFLHRLCCYDNNNGMYLTTILKQPACVRIWCMKFFVIWKMLKPYEYHSPFLELSLP